MGTHHTAALPTTTHFCVKLGVFPDPTVLAMAEQGCKLFVYGIDQGMQNSELQSEFDKFGQVVDVYNTGKGFAFVTFDQKEDTAVAATEVPDRDKNIVSP